MRTILLAGFVLAAVSGCGPGTPQSAASIARSAGSLRLDSGTRIEATTDRTISSRSDKAGATFSASVVADAKDSRGRVVIPAGSTLNLTITELKPATDKSKADGRITVVVNSVTVAGQTYPLSAQITEMNHTLKGRGVGEGEVEKTAAGVVLGGIAGRIIGGDAKGTVIGAVVGGAAGAAVAVETANRDVVVRAGTPLVVTLDGLVNVAVR